MRKKIKHEKSAFEASQDGIKNLMYLTKLWTRDIEKGKLGENILYAFLTSKGYQVLPIMHYEKERESKIYTKEEKMEKAKKTIFAPDFLVCSEEEIFFADAKWKRSLYCLGWVNVRDYEKYLKAQKQMGFHKSCFKIYWTINGKIYCLNKLIEDTSQFKRKPQPDGEVFEIPKKLLKLEGQY